MTNILLSIGTFRDVHDIDVITKNGRRFTIDIFKNKDGFNSEVTILDTISNHSGSWVYNTSPLSSSAIDNFRASIELIKKYIAKVDSTDEIQDIHNPCNTPFINEIEQNNVLSEQGVYICVRIN